MSDDSFLAMDMPGVAMVEMPLFVGKWKNPLRQNLRSAIMMRAIDCKLQKARRLSSNFLCNF
jgi:hypothetical protein